MKEFLPKAQAGNQRKWCRVSGRRHEQEQLRSREQQPPNRVVILKFPNAEAWKKFEDGANGKTLREEVSKKYAEMESAVGR